MFNVARRPGFLTTLTGILCILAGPGLAAVPAKPAPWVFDNVKRVVAVGDVHGAYSQFTAALRGAGLIDAGDRWTGGKTHLVSVGDLLDRGSDSRKVMELLMRLQEEAVAAGGRVHVVPGNHEIMNMTGDLRYVSPGEFAAFAADESAAQRDQAFVEWKAGPMAAGATENEARARFETNFPPGYFAHLAAFTPAGRYGSWIAGLPFFVRINDTVFLHGGLSDRMASPAGDALNETMHKELGDYLAATRALQARGLVTALADYGERFEGAEALVAAARARIEAGADAEGPVAISDEDLQALNAYLEMENALIFAPDGPLWYRGNAWCHPSWEPVRLQAALDNLGARRVAVGHTPTPSRRITTRLDGKVIMLDTGMLPYYEGRPAALEITSAGLRAYYADEDRWTEPLKEVRSLGARPAGMTDDDIEAFLKSADIVQSEELGTGVTKPLRLTLSQDGVVVRAVFKGEDTDTSGGSGTRRNYRLNLADSYKHDIAAYRLDKFLGIDLVPVTVERDYDGRAGSLQFWIENSISDLERREQNIAIYPVCDLQEQYDLMRVLDVLIYNEDRNQSNLLFDRNNGMLRLIDHSRSFRTHRGRPALYESARLLLSPDLAARLRALDREVLHELTGDLLDRKQIKALLKRRDEILEEADVVSRDVNTKGVAD